MNTKISIKHHCLDRYWEIWVGHCKIFECHVLIEIAKKDYGFYLNLKLIWWKHNVSLFIYDTTVLFIYTLNITMGLIFKAFTCTLD